MPLRIENKAMQMLYSQYHGFWLLGEAIALFIKKSAWIHNWLVT